MNDVLFFFQSESDVPSEFDGRTFIIESELNSLSEERHLDIYSSLMEMEVNSGTTLPIYKLSRYRLFSGAFSEDISPLVRYIHLASQVNECVSNGSIDKAVIKTVDKAYEPVILDVLNNTDIQVPSHREFRLSLLWERMSGKVKSLVSAMIVLLDQLIYCLLYSVFNLNSHISIETVFIPSQSRFNTTEPVLKHMKDSYALALERSLVGRLIGRNSSTVADEYDHIFSHQFSSPKTIFHNLKFILFSFLPSELLDNTTEESINENLNELYGFKLEFTIAQMYGRLYHDGLLWQIQRYFAYLDVFSKAGTNSVVISTGYSAGAEAVWLAAQRSDVTAYDLPHMITVNPPQTGVFTDYSFVTGPFAQRYIETHYPNQATGVLPTGRPYLETLNRAADQNINEPIQVLIATSPYSDKKRKQVLFQSINGIEEMPVNCVVKIKPHPSEGVEIYEQLQQEAPINFEIVEDGLQKELESADIVITVNSNVGLEAIVSGAISINMNFWRGLILPLPYALEGPVPILENPTSVQTFFRGLTIKQARSIQQKQQEFLAEGYYLSGSAERVASEAEATRTSRFTSR